MEACALVAEIPGHAGVYAVADAKAPGRDELRFTANELRALARHVTAAEI